MKTPSNRQNAKYSSTIVYPFIAMPAVVTEITISKDHIFFGPFDAIPVTNNVAGIKSAIIKTEKAILLFYPGRDVFHSPQSVSVLFRRENKF